MSTPSTPSPPSSPKPAWSEVMRAIAPYMDIGLFFMVVIVASVFLGRWIDNRLHTEPWFLIISALLGIAVAFYRFFLIVLRK